ncbi:MAG: hypothetical protein WCH74_12260 [Chloroflexota bacterium]
MTAGQIGVNRLDAPHHGARSSRRVAIGSAVVVLGLAVALAVPALVANNGPQAAAAPAAAVPAAAAPAVAAPAPALAPPTVYVPAGPNPVTHEQTPARPGTGRSWGRFEY